MKRGGGRRREDKDRADNTRPLGRGRRGKEGEEGESGRVEGEGLGRRQREDTHPRLTGMHTVAPYLEYFWNFSLSIQLSDSPQPISTYIANTGTWRNKE
jgi:hypothetical protein